MDRNRKGGGGGGKPPYKGQGGGGGAPSGGRDGRPGGSGAVQQRQTGPQSAGQGFSSSTGAGEYRSRGGGRGGGGRSSTTTFKELILPFEVKPTRLPGVNDLFWRDLPDKKGEIQLPIVPTRGTVHPGVQEQVTIRINHFLAPVQKNMMQGVLYQYEISTARLVLREGEPPFLRPIARLPRAIRVKVYDNACAQFKALYEAAMGAIIGIISDQSVQIYTTRRLDGIPLTVDVQEASLVDEVGSGTFRVSLNPVDGDIHMSELAVLNNLRSGLQNMNVQEQEAMMARIVTVSKAYNTLLKSLGDGRFMSVGRSVMRIPDLPNLGFDLGGGLVNWTGVSLIYNFGWKPYVNIDIVNSAFIVGKEVLKVLAEFFGTDDVLDVTTWSQDDVDKASNFLRGCKVRKTLPRAVVQDCGVAELERRSVSQIQFDLDGRMISVFEYYKTRYGVTLRCKNGPCLVAGNKSFVPAELCTIKKGKSYNGKLSDKQTTKMIDVARKEPRELEQSIMKAIDDLGMKNNPLLKSFGVSFEGKMLELNARVLAPPDLVYGLSQGKKGRAVVTPDPGKWDIWGSVKFDFFQAQTVKNWGILVVGCYASVVDDMRNFECHLRRLAAVRGMIMAEPKFIESLRMDDRGRHMNNVDTLAEEFQAYKKFLKYDPKSFILVVIPAKHSVIYKQVKQAAELFAGVLTQCIVKDNVKEGNRLESTIGNVVLKINAKLGGVNHVPIPPSDKLKEMMKKIDVLSYPAMIFGIDVTHPPPGMEKNEQKPPSFAAVTATVGRSAMPYMMHVQAQEKAERGAAEIVQGLDIIVEKMIKEFNRITNFKPVKLIIYRDGVGEGQFNEVLHMEMKAIRQACNSFGPEYRPRITFITVQKRHKTRFFYNDPKQGTVNVPPGTLVDTEIVHPTQLDFYLQSHVAIKGTARPTRYHMIWDDSDFTADQIQVLTYYLCFMYSRCNRSVKIPAPTYYAHWAASRAKVLAEGQQFPTLVELNNYIMQRESGGAGDGQSFATMFPMHFI